MDVSLFDGDHDNHNTTTGNSIESTSTMPCYFLRLPREVRDKILQYLLFSDEPLRLLESIDDDGGNQDEDDQSEDDEDDQVREAVDGSPIYDNESNESKPEEDEQSESEEDEQCKSEEDDHGEEHLDEKCGREGCYRNYAFSPQVMRTCRQLYEEGKLVLGSNTVGIDLCKYSNHWWQWAVAGRRQKKSWINGMKLGRNVERLFHEAVKFHIYMDLSDRNLRECYVNDEKYHKTPAMPHQLCKRLIEKGNLRECRIEITVGWDESLGDANIDHWRIVSPFKTLRCKEFRITGCQEITAIVLKYWIPSDEPLVNLYAMHDALEAVHREFSLREWAKVKCVDPSKCRRPMWLLGVSWIRAACTDTHAHFIYLERLGNHIFDAVVRHDVHGFLRLRSEFLKAIHNFQLKKERKIQELEEEELEEEELKKEELENEELEEEEK